MTLSKQEHQTVEASRPIFENWAFRMRFLMSIKKVGEGQFPFRVVGCPNMPEFVKRNDKGYYIDNTLGAMWASWVEALKWSWDIPE